MAQRLELQALLKTLAPNVYFQPPENTKLIYPCITYQRDFLSTRYADNKPYKHRKRYQITVIDKDPDSIIPDQVAELPESSFDRFFVADQLYHYVFNLFF